MDKITDEYFTPFPEKRFLILSPNLIIFIFCLEQVILNTRSNSSNSRVDTPLGVGGVVLPYEDKIGIFPISIVVLQRQNIHVFIDTDY